MVGDHWMTLRKLADLWDPWFVVTYVSTQGYERDRWHAKPRDAGKEETSAMSPEALHMAMSEQYMPGLQLHGLTSW